MQSVNLGNNGRDVRNDKLYSVTAGFSDGSMIERTMPAANLGMAIYIMEREFPLAVAFDGEYIMTVGEYLG